MHCRSKNLLHICMSADCLQHAIKKVFRVTKPLNILDEITDAMHYQHGRKEPCQLGETAASLRCAKRRCRWDLWWIYLGWHGHLRRATGLQPLKGNQLQKGVGRRDDAN